MIKRNKRGGRPSPYTQRFLFHGLRSAQLLSAIVVSGIMCYFMYYLHKERYPIPWTFITLFTVSLATIVALTVTIILYNFTYLSPLFNLILNSGLSVVWATGFGLLSWSISTSHVLAKACTKSVWKGVAEAGVCRDYKALWSMALIGTVSTLAALLLDAHTHRKSTRRGKYIQPEDDRVAEQLNDKKSLRVKSEGYEAPSEENAPGGSVFEQDIGYHSRYGHLEDESEAAVPHSPLGADQKENQKGMGYHNQFFQD